MKEFEYKGYKLKEGVVYYDNDSEFVLFMEGGNGDILFWLLDSPWDCVSCDDAVYLETDFHEEYLKRLYEVTESGFKRVEKAWQPTIGKVYLFSDYSLEVSIKKNEYMISALEGKVDSIHCNWKSVDGVEYKNIYKVPAELLGE